MVDFDFNIALVPGWLVAVLMVAAAFLAVIFVKRLILKHLFRVTDGRGYHYSHLFIRALSLPITLFIMLLHLYLLEFVLIEFDVKVHLFESALPAVSKILAILAIVLFSDHFLKGTLERQTARSDVLKNSKSILSGITRGLLYGIGILVLLGTMGISITPIIASLGITSLAVALALQPTLENFFSGVQLVMDKPVRVGDYIELESGEQGFVEKIGWRSTWIRMLPNNTIIMPNSALSQSKVINYFYPSKELSVPVDVGVHYSSDLEHVEKVTLEVAREILRSHKWGVETYETFVVYHTFDSSSINFTVMLRAKEYFNRFFIKSAFIKALHKRYREEGIVIPYPIRAINTDQEK